MHFTPVHGSWMTQVEQWFGILQRKRFTAPNFKSLRHVESRIRAFVREWNATVHPFRWTATSFSKTPAQCEGNELVVASAV